jgi:putative colanic acid biosynthesis acetyltransferase WcaF
MDLPQVDLSTYDASGFNRGANVLKEGLWRIVSLLLLEWCPLKLSALKCAVLRLFGARVGIHVVIKPGARITFPWKLTLGDHVWIGEEAWLLNLAPIDIGSHVCISPRAFLSTGNHDYKSPSFGLIVQPIVVERGAWIGAGAWVSPGVRIGSHAVLMAHSVASDDLEAFGIYRGNPATLVRRRVISES